MKVKILSLMFVGLLVVSLNCEAQDYEIGTWCGFADAAITYTFDDATAKQYTVAIPMLNEFDFKATFFPVISWGPDWTILSSAANQGHEIGSHTYSHPHLGTLSDSMQNVELKNSQDTINCYIDSQKCITIAYSFCEPSADSITRKYYIAARHCQGTIELTTPPDFYSISSIICGANGSIKTSANFKSTADVAATSHGWAVYLIHGIDNDGGYSSLSSTELRSSFEYLDTNRNKFWVSNFKNVVLYIRERNSALVNELHDFTDSLSVEVTDTLVDSIYNLPITVRRVLPTNWEYATARQNGVDIKDTVILIDTLKYIQFDAVPDGGEVMISVAEAPAVSGISENKEQLMVQLIPNPFKSAITIITDGYFNYRIHTVDGRLVEQGDGYNSKQIGSSYSSGMYLLNLNAGMQSLQQRIIKE
jgi:peptidoglycan/xylan/chitin deacetylase (PgdA/CDA1 family)